MTIFLITLFSLFLLTHSSLSPSPRPVNPRFSSGKYTGYLSENLASPTAAPPSHHPTTYPRHNRNLQRAAASTLQNIYVRFIDKLKPAILFDLDSSSNYSCESYRFNVGSDVKLQAQHDYESEQVASTFDLDMHECFPLDSTRSCLCYLNVRLIQRENINREAKSVYYLNVTLLTASSATLRVNILDDNDLEPMFAQYEYEFELTLNEYRPQYSVIGRVAATDPDLDVNANVRYYINCDHHHKNQENCNAHFGVDWMTGDIYLKHSTAHLFALTTAQFEFEILAIDTGLKLGLLRNLLRLDSSSSADTSQETLEQKLIQILQKNPVFSLNSSSNSQQRLERALVKVTLAKQRQLQSKIEIKSFDAIATIESLDYQLIEQIRFRLDTDDGATRMPLAVLSLKILSWASPLFQVERSNQGLHGFTPRILMPITF
jgi:hypothetical protein